MELCRVCLQQESELAPMFENTEQDVVEMILFCTGILFTKEEDLPCKICKKCIDELNTAHKFKTKCVSSEHTFHDLIRKIKDEPDELNHEKNIVILNNDKKDLADDYSSSNVVEVKEEDAIVECVRKSRRVKLKRKNENGKLPAPPTKKRGKYNKPGKPRVLKYKFRKLYCETCDIKFVDKQASDEHKREAHKDQNWICEICGKVFNYRASHLTHVRSHFPPQFACDQCDYKSCSKYDLVKHVRVHTGVKAYKCSQCPAAYYTVSNLRSHERLLHERLRPFACQLCDKAFFDRTKLNRHLDSHNEIKRHCCDVCHACFTRRCYWKKHLLRQHNIIIPPMRPGRQKANVSIEELTATESRIVPYRAVEG